MFILNHQYNIELNKRRHSLYQRKQRTRKEKVKQHFSLLCGAEGEFLDQPGECLTTVWQGGMMTNMFDPLELEQTCSVIHDCGIYCRSGYDTVSFEAKVVINIY